MDAARALRRILNPVDAELMKHIHDAAAEFDKLTPKQQEAELEAHRLRRERQAMAAPL